MALSLSHFLKTFLSRYARSNAFYPQLEICAYNATLPTPVICFIYSVLVIDIQLKCTKSLKHE